MRLIAKEGEGDGVRFGFCVGDGFGLTVCTGVSDPLSHPIRILTMSNRTVNLNKI